MRLAIMRVMALTLLRDRGALAMSFILPGAVFVIFALVFSGAAGGDLTVRLARPSDSDEPAPRRLVARILESRRVERVGPETATATAVRDLVRDGSADAALVIRRTQRALDDLSGDGPPAIEIVAHPAREIAATMLQGIVFDAYLTALPEATVASVARLIDTQIVGLDPAQRARLEAGLTAMRQAKETSRTSAVRADRIVARQDVARTGTAPPAVTYYAGAVAMLFLMFSALTGAVGLIEERESGLLDRVATGPGGVGVMIDGRFLFLVIQGFMQALVIFLVAWLAFGVDLPGHIGAWAATSLAAAVAAAGSVLAFVTLCRSKQQATTLGQMLILVLSAVGGSMVPRYLMPAPLQQAGWATPNTWALEAYSALFTRSEGAELVPIAWGVLAATGLAGLVFAHVVARRTIW